MVRILFKKISVEILADERTIDNPCEKENKKSIKIKIKEDNQINQKTEEENNNDSQ